MAYDMGEAVGKVSLDASGVVKGAEQASNAFEGIGDASDKSLDKLADYAHSLEDILNGAYKDLAKSSEQVKAAQEAYNAVLAAGEAKAQTYADAIAAAEKKQADAVSETERIQQQLTQAQEQAAKSLQRYLDLRDRETVNQKTLEAANEKYQRDLQVEASLKDQLVKAQEREQQASEAVTRAKTQYADVITKTSQEAATAADKVARAEEQAGTIIAQNAAKQLQAINDVRGVRNQASDEHVRQTKEEADAVEEAAEKEKKAAQEAAQQQALAFAIAAKAVDELVEGLKAVVSKTLEISKEIVQTGADFETAMAQVAATSKMSAEDVSRNIQDYQDLTNAAKEAGLSTMYSASEAAEALNYLALAGYSVEESIEYMPASLTLAAAGAMDLGQASDMVTDAISALGLELTETNSFIDKMATTAQSSNTNIQQLGRAILTVGGTASVLAGGVTELDTALGILANNGIKAAQGGTSLRQILVNLTKPSKQAAEIIDELGLKIYDADGNMRHLNEIFGDLNEIMKDFSDKDRMEVITHLFDARQLRTANALMKDSGEAWDNLQQKLENANGSAEKMAETMRSNLNGAINIAKSNLDALAITIYEGVQKNITDLVNESIPKFKELNAVIASPDMQSRLETLSSDIKDIASSLLDVVIDAAPKVLAFITNLKGNLASLQSIITAIIGINIIAHIDKIIEAFQALSAVLVANPWIALITAITAVTVAIQQVIITSEAAHKALVAQVTEQNDLYAEQRKEVEGVVDEWNNYKETAGKVKDEAQDQATKVRGLYEEYVKLKDSGEDTTLAMQALADEIPELADKLAEGQLSFEDITESVDKYCESLIRTAELEAAKETYTQAIKTRSELKHSIDEQKQAMIESGEAAEEARIALQKYNDSYDYQISQIGSRAAKQELERLKADYQAKSDIYAENARVYSQSAQALVEADKAVEDSRADFNEAIKKDFIEEGKVYADHDKATAAESEKRARQSAAQAEENAEKRQEQQQAEVDELLGQWDQLDKKIAARQITEEEKWNIIGDWFEANPDWDRDNEDLLKQYDKYMTFKEKGEEALRKQEDDDAKKRQQEEDKRQKEREQNLKKQVSRDLTAIDDAKDAGDLVGEEYIKALEDHRDRNAAFYQADLDEQAKIDRKINKARNDLQDQQVKDNEKARKKIVQDDLNNIEHLKKVYEWSDKEYNDALKEHLEIHNAYYEDYADERQKLQWKIEENDAAIAKQQKEDAKKESEAYFKTWTDGYEDLLEEATKAYNELEKERTKFQDNLLKSVELYGTKTEKVWDRASHKYKDVSVTGITSTKELKEQLKDIQEFDKTMQSLKKRGVSEDLLSTIWGMDTEKAMEFADALNKMSSGELQTYSKTYQGIVDQTTKMSDEYYQTQINDFNEKYITPLQQYTEKTAKELQANMGNIGQDTISGWITGMEQKSAESEDAVKDIMDQGITTAKKALGIASPSKEFFTIGEFTIQGFLNGIQSKIENFANIFATLGQKAGESFITSFKSTWDNFINLLNTTGGLTVPATMTTSMFGTPVNNGSQIVYSNSPSSYTGLTKADVISAIKEAVPDGDIILAVNETQFGRVSRRSLNLLAEQQGTLGLQV